MVLGRLPKMNTKCRKTLNQGNDHLEPGKNAYTSVYDSTPH